jgi:hypothetical protein
MWPKVRKYNYTFTLVRNRRISVFGAYTTKYWENTIDFDWKEVNTGTEYLFYFNPDNTTYPETNSTINKLIAMPGKRI